MDFRTWGGNQGFESGNGNQPEVGVENHIYCNSVHSRIEQLFDIIVEFPESEPALLDLKACLEKASNLRSLLVKSLKTALETRLLHPGM